MRLTTKEADIANKKNYDWRNVMNIYTGKTFCQTWDIRARSEDGDPGPKTDKSLLEHCYTLSSVQLSSG